MEFLSKILYFVLFGLTCLLCLFFILSSINVLMDAYGKKSESIIMGLAGILVAIGLYISYQAIKDTDRYLYCSGILGITWLVVLGVVLIGLFFFNGPLRWQ